MTPEEQDREIEKLTHEQISRVTEIYEHAKLNCAECQKYLISHYNVAIAVKGAAELNTQFQGLPGISQVIAILMALRMKTVEVFTDSEFGQQQANLIWALTDRISVWINDYCDAREASEAESAKADAAATAPSSTMKH